MILGNIVIKKPVITEKSLSDVKSGVYTFDVDKAANKIEITKEVERLFNVHVTGINTLIIKGKVKLVGKKRRKSKLADKKRARVKLKKGEIIELFEVGGKT
ncbi:50S ribosomal protein L23 [Candidatus Gottesmanbacteria bacterium RIFCSPHIGHO2_02_FULL_40_24]|uniref:Large ribosomal subunit protein uL23 n=1 Tax=Candidatus Gottesmanbacteria bacterium RIFCSPHIGHO2_01_FULL_40_15 TaxID=1798376 RepID=A0A1F5Z6K4_9BACT|nr:MAG: 50S ribosomal protein L23 [Candidatus Gottesmanbacteria bacterium RIFCSPHIGHO2_01_FULL_40_15]OGG18215.1 MAG: 50S ribosomal protein L23 [Candidatus Gottesmanbacteria bacterium RIFCSPHIGHO2_02_FULL_40_24]OGG22883.1 MAG: 50S ribosomal protein L23 [Candidatus Gottesmanbacteria bacterium RIFCSPLOWO2_01_FULL_40_10]OGG23499.1 MAG: 50S ribosomal protein L23 [Candidatus Gottesmanbacteria bacterium RIFCSPHIGHO2_12_FULL_40_13]OGG32501.1 MAG: 50S ribosomal protein L23 [Candidatus Gottesmanbacteria 